MAMSLSQPHTSPSAISSSSASFYGSSLQQLRSRTTARNLRNSHSIPHRYTFKASWQELAGVLIFSAIPFTAVKAIANSPLGESLQRHLEKKKKAAVANSSKFKALAEEARKDRWITVAAVSFDNENPGDYNEILWIHTFTKVSFLDGHAKILSTNPTEFVMENGKCYLRG